MQQEENAQIDWKTSPHIAVNDAVAAAMEKTDPSDSIDALLLHVGQSMHADRAYIFEIKQGNQLCNTFEWCAEGVTPQIANLQCIPLEVCERTWLPHLRENEPVIIKDMREYEKQDPVVAEMLREQQIESLLVIPLALDGELVGFIGIDNPAHGVADGMAAFLETLSSFTTSLLRNRDNVQRLSDLSSHDRVSGAYDTLYLLERLERARETGTEPQGDGLDAAELGELDEIAVIYFNLVQFKEFNGAFGMAEGNSCLHDVAGALGEVFGKSCVSRYSADHFIVFCRSEKAQSRVDEAHERVMGLRPGFRLWLEAGLCTPARDQSLSLAVDLAKVACDQIVEDGRSYSCLYSGKIEEELERKKYLQDHIEQATEEGWVQVYYQPVMRTLTGRLAGAEALSRWHDPVYGEVSPGVFVPALEEKHLSWHLLEFVVDQVCSDLATRYHAGLPVVPVSVNVSRTDFESCEPYEVISRAVQAHDIPSSLICVEITESVAMLDPKGIEAVVEQFKEGGYEVWMDDFGSAYSSLNTLKDFSFGKLKLDMLFMHDFNDRSKTIIGSIVAMAKKLGVHTLAEGVETKEQLDFLAEIGCEEIQGFYFSRPLPLDELLSYANLKGNEDLESRELFNELGLVELQDNEAAGYVFWKDDTVKLLFANERMRRYLEEDGLGIREELDALLNSPHGHFAKAYRTAVASALENGASETFPFVVNRRRYQMKFQTAARNAAGSVLVVKLREVTAFSSLVSMTDQKEGFDLTPSLPPSARLEVPSPTAGDVPGAPREARSFDERGLSLPVDGVQPISMVIQHSTGDELQTFSALTSIFMTLVNLDLVDWKLRPIVIAKVTQSFLSGSDLDYRETVEKFLERSVAESYRPVLRDFTDQETLVARLSRYGTLAIDYMSANLGWCRLFLIPYAVNDEGQVTKALFAVRDINAEKTEENRLAYGMNHDPLTKAFNRNGLGMVIDMVRGNTAPMAYVMIDIDFFKEYNDSFGHKEGDALLIRVVRMLIDTFGATDYVARLGGDEFVVVLTNYEADRDGTSIRERVDWVNEALRQGLESLGDDFARSKVSLSAGIVISLDGYRDDFYELADEALYQEKASGKGGSRVRVVGGEDD